MDTGTSIQIIFTEAKTEKPHGFLICSKILVEESLSSLREVALAEISDVLPTSFLFTTNGVPISSKQELAYPTKFFLKKSKNDPMIMGLDAMCISIISSPGQSDKVTKCQEAEKHEKSSSKPVMDKEPNTTGVCEPEKVREATGKAKKRTQFRIPTPDFECEPVEEKREKPDPFEFTEDDSIEEDTIPPISDQDLQSDDSNGANEITSLSKDELKKPYETIETASQSKNESEKLYQTIEILDEPDSIVEDSFDILSRTGNFVQDEQPSSSTTKERDTENMKSKYKPNILQTYFGSAQDNQYPHARSKNIEIYSGGDISKAKGFNVHRLRFWNEKAEELSKSPVTRNWKKEQIHGAIDADWTLKKTTIMKQEVRALEDKVEHLKEIYKNMDENILLKTNVAKNEDRVGAAAKVVDDCNEALVDIKDQMNQCFVTSERQNLRKEKTRLETAQKSNWVDLKKAQDALRKSLDQARKNVSAEELEQAERRLQEEERTEEFPELDQIEENQLVTSVKTTFYEAN